MRQSDQRAPSRGAPPSFGRPEEPELLEEEDEGFSVPGGPAFHLALTVDVAPSPESLAALQAAVREAVKAGVLEGSAAAFEEMGAAEPVPGVPGQPGS